MDNDRHAITLGGAVAGTWRGTRATFDLWSQLHILAPRSTSDGTLAATTSPALSSMGTIVAAGTNITVTF
jgi:hypothetical protein